VPVSLVVGEGFNMRVRTCKDEYPSMVVSWFTNVSYQECFHRQCRRRRKPESSQRTQSEVFPGTQTGQKLAVLANGFVHINRLISCRLGSEDEKDRFWTSTNSPSQWGLRLGLFVGSEAHACVRCSAAQSIVCETRSKFFTLS